MIEGFGLPVDVGFEDRHVRLPFRLLEQEEAVGGGLDDLSGYRVRLGGELRRRLGALALEPEELLPDLRQEDRRVSDDGHDAIHQRGVGVGDGGRNLTAHSGGHGQRDRDQTDGETAPAEPAARS